jgi:hypothetical protein
MVGVFPAGPRFRRDRIPDFGRLSGGAFAGDDEHRVGHCLAACTTAPSVTSNGRVIKLTVKRCFTAALVANGRLWREAVIDPIEGRVSKEASPCVMLKKPICSQTGRIRPKALDHAGSPRSVVTKRALGIEWDFAS